VTGSCRVRSEVLERFDLPRRLIPVRVDALELDLEAFEESAELDDHVTRDASSTDIGEGEAASLAPHEVEDDVRKVAGLHHRLRLK
jgi:hypothetical protein